MLTELDPMELTADNETSRQIFDGTPAPFGFIGAVDGNFLNRGGKVRQQRLDLP